MTPDKSSVNKMDIVGMAEYVSVYTKFPYHCVVWLVA